MSVGCGLTADIKKGNLPDLAENIRDLEPLDFGSFMSPAGTSEGRVAPPEVDAAPDLRGASVASTRLGCELRRCGEGGKKRS